MKGVQELHRLCGKAGLYLKRNSPTILSCVGVAGVVATTIMAIKATPKALVQIRHDSRKAHDGDPHAYTKFEAVKSGWRYYVPTAVVGASTIACIFGANVLNKKQQASIASAYILLENAYKEYKSKVKNMFGEDSDALVRRRIVKDRYEDGEFQPSGEAFLFYEYNHGDFFERTREEVLSAEYRFNLKFASKGYANLNDFYELLDLPKTESGERLSWIFDNMNNEYPWVDFEHELVELEDGMECYIINLPISPTI